MAKRGRKPKHYVTSWGETVEGLRRRPDGRFMPVGSSNVSFGKDELKAIAKFRKWLYEQQAGDASEPVVRIEARSQTPLGFVDVQRAIRLDDVYSDRQAGDPVEQVLQLTETQLGAIVQRFITQDPKRAARLTGIEELARLDSIKPPEPSLSIDVVGELYFDRPKGTGNWKAKSKRFWNQFTEIVAAQTVRDITADDINRYHDTIYEKYREGGLSPTFVFHRFGTVKTIFSHALNKGRDADELQRVLSLCRMLIPPEKNGLDPQPITPEHFGKLLDVADSMWEAFLLIALNAAMYPSEVAAIRKNEIDLDAATLVMTRAKTRTPRIAVLWSRTIRAIQAYQRQHPHESQHLFVSGNGSPYEAQNVSRRFATLRRKAKLPDSIKFNQIRDGAYTAAIEGGADALRAQLLAGHRTGIKDHYVKRNPTMVADCCLAIEQHYFGT